MGWGFKVNLFIDVTYTFPRNLYWYGWIFQKKNGKSEDMIILPEKYITDSQQDFSLLNKKLIWEIW